MTHEPLFIHLISPVIFCLTRRLTQPSSRRRLPALVNGIYVNCFIQFIVKARYDTCSDEVNLVDEEDTQESAVQSGMNVLSLSLGFQDK